MWILLLLGVGFSTLAPECEEGEYEVTGHKTGMAVKLNYTSSMIHKEGDTTYLSLDFLVPDMYFYNAQNVSGIIYDRSFQITFHDRVAGDSSACFTTRTESGSENCPAVVQDWTETDEATDSCMQSLTGKLPWDEMMRADYHDSDRILITTANRTINGFNTPTWEVYMTAIIETWAGFEEVSPTASSAVPGQLTINEERYSYYEIPFRISWPQQITLVAPPIRVAAPMVTLYAVIEQEIQDINFNPQDGENFGTVELKIKTQTQYPFGLRNFTDPVAPALIRTISGDIDGDPVWISADNPESCVNVDGSEDNYLCEQTWTVLITPNLCDVSGEYQMEMWAICFTDADGCALDDNAPDQSSNTWTGYLDFTVEAQNFCPQIVDEITVEAYIDKYAEETYTTEAVPGENVFSNDYVWFEVTYATRSLKAGYTFEQGDDSLIESVRPTKITMTVSMNTEPLQFAVERSHGDVEGTTTEYTLTLCEATPAVFPYNSVADDCFDEANKGWNAINYLDFQESVNNVGANTIDLNEIGFSLRLDERVIPVDLPNDAAVITIDVESEVYYYGNDNPDLDDTTGRRVLAYISRRTLTATSDRRVQRMLASDTFGIVPRSVLSWCSLNSQGDGVTFEMDVVMDSLQMPTTSTVEEDVMQLELSLTQHFQTTLNSIDILAVMQCTSDENCRELWSQADGKQTGTNEQIEYIRYYIHVPQVSLAQQLQDELYNGGSVYYTEWFAPSGESAKRLRNFKIDQCAGDFGLDTVANDDIFTPLIDDGASHLMIAFVFLSMVFMF